MNNNEQAPEEKTKTTNVKREDAAISSKQQAANNNSNSKPGPSPPKAPLPAHYRRAVPAVIRRAAGGQVIVTAAAGEPVAGVATGSPLELTSAGAVATTLPPKRPTRLPNRYATGLGIHGQLSAGAGGDPKPNRYSWAQMQHWQQQHQQQQHQQAQQQHHERHHLFSSAASRVLVVNPMQIVNLSEHTKSSLIKFIEAVKRFSEKWFSHVLLLMFLAVYACFGAYIFISFEAPTEQWEKQLIIDTRASLLNESWHEASSKTREQFVDLFRVKLEDYERLLNRACASGMTSSSLENQWTFWGALFYSMTVFTTIGYGHLTPVTFAGRVATMVYAIFGIPILLMVLADLGKLLTRIIKYAFKKFNYLFNKLLRRKSSVRTRKLISDNTHQYIGVARDAFERGYAYVQHQPAAMRVNSLKQRLFLRSHPPAPAPAHVPETEPEPGVPVDSGELEQQVDATIRMDETTDVIVTPAKQTKPVSPPISKDGADTKKSLADTVIQAHHQAAAAPGHPHHRAHSPAFRIKRKVSTSGLMGARRHQQQQQQPASKSSAKTPPSTPGVQQSTKKLVGETLPTSAGEQLKSDTIQSDADATDETAANVELDEEEPTTTIGEGEEEIEGDEDFEAEEEEEELEDEFDIPVSFALFLLVTYMMFGAVVFSIWEGWNFFDSLYFVFISMSTIGFGDLVPQHPKRMIGTFIYLLFGLALTSMCINVVQEKIHATFLRAKMQIGEKMGFDLDQIMADDYYDGSLVYDVEGNGGGGGGGEGDDTNSLAVSQTYSDQHQHHHNHHNHHLHQEETSLISDPNNTGRTISQSLDNPAHEHGGPAPLKQSKSRESLKMKKRSVASLPGAHSSTGSSFKRKPSQKHKQMSRQTTPSSATPAAAGPSQPQAEQQQPPKTNVIQQQQQQPLRSQIEVHRTEPMMLLLQADHQPVGINAPVSGFRSVCEPLDAGARPATILLANGTGRPKLTSTRSLQPSNYRTEPIRSSSTTNESPTRAGGANSGGSFRSGSEAPDMNHYRRLPIKSSSYQCKSDLEAALSRRSSVSHELNQLDDLIVALGRSPSDKFGPLLGIPSSSRRSSRSNSPSRQSGRRGTSMTSRSPPPPSNNRAVQRNASNIRPLNLSESQAALDELESLRLRL